MAKKNPKDFNKIAKKIIARAWGDELFLQRLKNNPKSVFSEYGLPYDENVSYRIVEDTNNVTHIVMPKRPYKDTSRKELSDEELEKIAAGSGHCLPTTVSWGGGCI